MDRKILHIVNISFVLPYYLGDQIDFFKKRGYSVSVACSPSDHLVNFCRQKDISCYPVTVNRSFSIRTDLATVFTLIKIIKQNNIEVVIGHTPKGALLAMLASRLAGVKNRIYFRHGLVFETSTGLKKQLLLGIERLTSALASKIVNVSPSVLNKIGDLGLACHEKDLILNKGTCNGIDLERFSRKMTRDRKLELLEKYGLNGCFIVGYVGRLVSDKGINELIRSWPSIIAQAPNVKLLLVGPYEERDKLSQDTINYIKETDSIVEIGLTENTQEFYELMQVFILPSYREGFPTVVLEASAMELPVITTRATGCIDAIQENITGVFTKLNEDDIKNSILFYYNNRLKVAEHGKNGRIFVERDFQQKVIWKEIESKLYDSI